jgi:hypothetical protein
MHCHLLCLFGHTIAFILLAMWAANCPGVHSTVVILLKFLKVFFVRFWKSFEREKRHLSTSWVGFTYQFVWIMQKIKITQDNVILLTINFYILFFKIVLAHCKKNSGTNNIALQKVKSTSNFNLHALRFTYLCNYIFHNH